MTLTDQFLCHTCRSVHSWTHCWLQVLFLYKLQTNDDEYLKLNRPLSMQITWSHSAIITTLYFATLVHVLLPKDFVKMQRFLRGMHNYGLLVKEFSAQTTLSYGKFYVYISYPARTTNSHTKMTSKKQLLHSYSCTSWWWLVDTPETCTCVWRQTYV